MIITGMDHFQSVCKKKLVEWYQKNRPETPIDLSNVFIVWSCKTLQNYKCLASYRVDMMQHYRHRTCRRRWHSVAVTSKKAS